MTTYKAPLRDMQFVMQDLLNFEKHYQSLPACDEVNQELIDAILGGRLISNTWTAAGRRWTNPPDMAARICPCRSG
jgi:hypothetical protein